MKKFSFSPKSGNVEKCIKYELSTNEFAALNLTKRQSIIERLSKTGCYYGLIPLKRQNGRLLWPKEQVQRLPEMGANPLLATEQFAAHHGLLPSSVRSRYYLTGSYYGTTPQKLPGGRLGWPDKQVKEGGRS